MPIWNINPFLLGGPPSNPLHIGADEQNCRFFTFSSFFSSGREFNNIINKLIKYNKNSTHDPTMTTILYKKIDNMSEYSGFIPISMKFEQGVGRVATNDREITRCRNLIKKTSSRYCTNFIFGYDVGIIYI